MNHKPVIAFLCTHNACRKGPPPFEVRFPCATALSPKRQRAKERTCVNSFLVNEEQGAPDKTNQIDFIVTAAAKKHL